MASKPDEQESTTIIEAADAVGGRTVPLCQVCSTNNKTTAAQVYCQDYKAFQCLECSDHHKALAFMPDHTNVDWRLQGPDEKAFKMFGFDKCSQDGNPVTIYCEDHDLFCCATCGFSGHKLCGKAKFIREFSVDLNSFQDILTVCNEKALKIINTFNAIGKKEERDIKEKAETLKEELIHKMDRDTTMAIKGVQKVGDALKSSKEEDISKVYSIQEDLLLWRKSLSAASEQGLHEQCFILCKTLKKRTIEFNELLNKQSIDTISISVHAECHPDIETLVKGDEHLIKLLQDNASVLESGSETLEKNPATTTESSGNSSTVTAKDPKGNERKQTFQLTRMATLAFTKTKEICITGVDFFSDGRLIAVDNSQKKCFLLDEDLDVLGKYFVFYINKESNPFDVCVYSENRAAVTTSNRLFFLQIDQQNRITLNKKVSTSSLYCCITRFNCSMFLCSTNDNDNGPVCVVDFKGKESSFTDTGFPYTKYKLDESFSTYITSLGIIVLKDQINSKVHLFNILSGKNKTVEDDRIQEPSKACVAPDDTVFVNCLGNDTIVRISPEGIIIQVLCLGFMPIAVRISKDEKLVVSCYQYGNHKMKLYNLSNQ